MRRRLIAWAVNEEVETREYSAQNLKTKAPGQTGIHKASGASHQRNEGINTSYQLLLAEKFQGAHLFASGNEWGAALPVGNLKLQVKIVWKAGQSIVICLTWSLPLTFNTWIIYQVAGDGRSGKSC